MKIFRFFPGIFIGLLSTLFLFILFTDQQPLSKDEQQFAYLIDKYEKDVNEIFPVVNNALITTDALVKKIFSEISDNVSNPEEILINVSYARDAIFSFKELDLQLSVLEYQIRDVESFKCENYFLKIKKDSFLKKFYKQKKALDQKKKAFLDFLDEKMNENAPEKKDLYRI